MVQGLVQEPRAVDRGEFLEQGLEAFHPGFGLGIQIIRLGITQGLEALAMRVHAVLQAGHGIWAGQVPVAQPMPGVFIGIGRSDSSQC